MKRLPAFAILALALAAGLSFAHAQDLPASASSSADMGTMPGMDHGSMDHVGMDHGATPGMDMPAHAAGAQAHGSAQSAPMPDRHAMPMSAPMPMPHPHEPAVRRNRTGATGDHAMGPMQGGAPPPDARDPDYSDGIPPAPMHGVDMGMQDDARRFSLRVDQLEAFRGGGVSGQQWDVEGGYGNNRDRLWLRSEGERTHGQPGTADLEALWQHAVTAFWDTQLGVRTDMGDGPARHWVAFGLQGLAPYWFELEATGYAGPAGRTAARLRADYELLLTQRLVLQPELELNAYGKADPARGLGSGLSDASLGLRLRYEFRREVAPYVGWEWTRRFGGTAALGRDSGEGPSERRWVAGVRIWF